MKKVGDKVKPGDVLCGIETDKAVVDFEMQEEGYVARILYPDGAKDIKLGSAIAVISYDQKDVPAFADWVAGGAPNAAPVAAK
jgi:pyruvate dehydrogenase E2 component (dihydrolipoamide acetyltransferase)